MTPLWLLNRTSRYLLALCLGLLVVLCWLGFWQLERAAYKRVLEDRYFDNLAAIPLGEQSLASMNGPQTNTPGFAFRTLNLTGYYLGEKNFLLDNQIYKSQVGYRVITPFRSNSGQYYLIDRGWLPAGSDRAVLPRPGYPEKQVTVFGVIWPNLGLPPLLKDSALDDVWPKRIQRADITRMQSAFLDAGVEVFPYLLRLEAYQAGVFTVLTPQVSFSAERHTGYAVQWFGLALTLIVGLIILGRKQDQ